MQILTLPKILAVWVAIAIAGCGSGGGGSTDQSQPTPLQPTSVQKVIDSSLAAPFPDSTIAVSTPPGTASSTLKSVLVQSNGSVVGGMGILWYQTTASVAPNGWWGISIPASNMRANYLQNNEHYSVVAKVTPSSVSGDTDIYTYVWNTTSSTYRKFLRGSALAGPVTDESHLFRSDLQADDLGVFWVYADGKYNTGTVNFTFELYIRPQVALKLPTQLPGSIQDYYTPYTIPITAVMDNSIGTVDEITTYDGATTKRDFGCKRYFSNNNYQVCDRTSDGTPSTNGGPILGYQTQDGGRVLTGINYIESNNTYVFYDEHTGYDFLPTNAPKGVAVYAAFGGTIHFVHDAYNTVYIEHGDGWSTYYLHMIDDAQHVYPGAGDGAWVGTGYQIGNIGNTCSGCTVGSHLHFTVKNSAVTTNGTRVDPYVREQYGFDLWR